MKKTFVLFGILVVSGLLAFSVLFSGQGTIDFYEGNGCRQNIVCSMSDDQVRCNCKDHACGCENDEIRSVKLNNVRAGCTILLYDHPRGSTDDDWTEIYVKKSKQTYCVGTLENDIDDEYVKVTHHHNNGLDGKVSLIIRT